MRFVLCAAFVAVVLSTAARAERLTVALSSPEVQINSSFSGAALTVFGVIERDASTLSRTGSYDVAVVLVGPPETVVARRKEHVLGIWANRGAQTIAGVPALYSLSSSAKLDLVATSTVLSRLQVGYDNIAFRFEGDPTLNDPVAKDFRDAFIRLKEKAGLYHQQVGVNFIGDTIFRTTLFLPANIPVGRYTAEAYLFSGQSLVARAEDTLRVSKTGVEDNLFNFAHGQSLIYGLLCVLTALVVGWLGGVIFRRD
ncbi:TIGR02186 family protein [soil metagenome]